MTVCVCVCVGGWVTYAVDVVVPALDVNDSGGVARVRRDGTTEDGAPGSDRIVVKHGSDRIVVTYPDYMCMIGWPLFRT